MNEKQPSSDQRFQEVFGQLKKNTPKLDPSFERMLAQQSEDMFQSATKQRKPTVAGTWLAASVLVAAGIGGLVWFAPVWMSPPTSTGSGPQLQVAAHTATLPNASCWKLRSAITASETELDDLLEQQLATRPRVEKLGLSMNGTNLVDPF